MASQTTTKALPPAERLPRQNPLLRPWVLRIAVLLAVALLWQLLGTVADTVWFPPFSQVLDRIRELIASSEIQSALATSLVNLAGGYGLAVAVGLVVGIGMALVPRVEDAFRPYVDAGLFVPPVVFAPVFFAFFGQSRWTLVSVVFVFAVFVVIVSTETAVRGTDELLLEMGRSFGASRLRLITSVILPNAAPMIFAGLQLGIARAVKGLIVGEIVVTVVGLGSLERQYSSSFDSAGIWAIAIIVVALALVLTTAIQLLGRVLTGWTGRGS